MNTFVWLTTLITVMTASFLGLATLGFKVFIETLDKEEDEEIEEVKKVVQAGTVKENLQIEKVKEDLKIIKEDLKLNSDDNKEIVSLEELKTLAPKIKLKRK